LLGGSTVALAQELVGVLGPGEPLAALVPAIAQARIAMISSSTLARRGRCRLPAPTPLLLAIGSALLVAGTGLVLFMRRRARLAH
jgi:hypothetical protein